MHSSTSGKFRITIIVSIFIYLCVHVLTDKLNHKLHYFIGENFCLEESVEEHFFTVTCIQFAVNPIPEIQLSIIRIVDGIDTYLDRSNIDVFTSNISEKEYSLSVSGTISFSEGYIKVICEVSNANGNDSATTFVTPCSKFK